MRICTLALSVVAHIVVALAVLVAPLLAVGPLPAPRRALSFQHTVFVEPAPPRLAGASMPATSTNAAPVTPPPSITPEPALVRSATAGDPALPGFDHPGSGASFDGLGTVPAADPEPPPPPAVSRGPVRVGGVIQPPQKVHHVAPEYPALARVSRVEGLVVLEAVVAEDGTVREVRVLRSVPLLDGAAVQAVRQWRFNATRLNGEPVPVVMTVTVSFSLR